MTFTLTTFRYKLKVKITQRGRTIGKKDVIWLLPHVPKFLKRRYKTKMIAQDLTNIPVFYHTYIQKRTLIMDLT